MTLDDRFHPEALLEHAGWMRGLARRLVREDEEDLVQESWLAALKRAPSGLPPGQPLGPWLASVTRNLAANRKRGDATRSARERDHGVADRAVPTPEELVERSEAHRGVVDAVLALDEPIRATMLLRYFEGLSAAKIAARTGVPQGTVRTRLHRGIAKLREELDAAHNGDRKRWVMALTPLAGFPGPAAATPATVPAFLALAMTSFKLLALAVPLLALFVWLRSGDAPTEGLGPPPVTETLSAGGATPGNLEPQAPNGMDRSITPRTAQGRIAPAAGPTGNLATAQPTAPPEPRVIQLVDERTGEPAWDYVIATVPAPGSGASAQIRSDRLGRMTLPAGVIAVAPIDRMLDRQQVPAPFGGSPGRPDDLPLTELDEALAVPFGRAAIMGIEAPAELDLTGAFAELRAESGTWDRLLASAPLRRFEGRTYARFPEYAAKELTGASLRVLTANGKAGASVEAAPYVGTGVTAPIVFESLAALTAELVPPAGVELEDPFATLFDATDRGAPTTVGQRVNHHRARMVDGIARFEYLGLSPGEYKLESRAGGLYSQTTPLTLTASTHGIQRVQLVQDPSRAPMGAVDITFVSATGTFHRPLEVMAIQYGSNGASVRSKWTDIAWTQSDGAWSGTARIEALTEGIHALEFSDAHDQSGPAPLAYLIDPAAFEVRPGQRKEILIHDDREFEHRIVRAVDADTLEPIEFVDVQYRSGADETVLGYVQGMDFEARLPFLRTPKALKLQIASDDHIPLDVPEGALTDGDLTVKLKRGWACHFAAKGEDNLFIDGIEVMIDGVSAGKTSSTELFLITRDKCPDHVAFRAPGWRIVSAPFLNPKGQIVAGSRKSASAHIITVAPE